jgi:hypothetical protein
MWCPVCTAVCCTVINRSHRLGRIFWIDVFRRDCSLPLRQQPAQTRSHTSVCRTYIRGLVCMLVCWAHGWPSPASDPALRSRVLRQNLAQAWTGHALKSARGSPVPFRHGICDGSGGIDSSVDSLNQRLDSCHPTTSSPTLHTCPYSPHLHTYPTHLTYIHTLLTSPTYIPYSPHLHTYPTHLTYIHTLLTSPTYIPTLTSPTLHTYPYSPPLPTQQPVVYLSSILSVAP